MNIRSESKTADCFERSFSIRKGSLSKGLSTFAVVVVEPVCLFTKMKVNLLPATGVLLLWLLLNSCVLFRPFHQINNFICGSLPSSEASARGYDLG